MVKEFYRQKRVAQEMKKEISVIFQHKIKDPRINTLTTISNVEISRDLAYAKVFVTFLGEKDKQSIKTNISILQNASGFIRSILGKTMYLRTVPEITFLYDKSLDNGIRISNLITNVIKKR